MISVTVAVPITVSFTVSFPLPTSVAILTVTRCPISVPLIIPISVAISAMFMRFGCIMLRRVRRHDALCLLAWTRILSLSTDLTAMGGFRDGVVIDDPLLLSWVA